MKKILVIDDEKDICILLKDILEAEGYEVVCGFSGKECIEKVKNDGFELVLLDIMMPDLSGEEVVDLMRNEGEKIPIVFVSIKPKAEVNLEQVSGFVQKPFVNKDLLKVVKGVV